MKRTERKVFGTSIWDCQSSLACRRKCGQRRGKYQSSTGFVLHERHDSEWGEGGLLRRCHMQLHVSERSHDGKIDSELKS